MDDEYVKELYSIVEQYGDEETIANSVSKMKLWNLFCSMYGDGFNYQRTTKLDMAQHIMRMYRFIERAKALNSM